MTAAALHLRIMDRTSKRDTTAQVMLDRLEQLKPVVTYPRDAILTVEHLAAAFDCSPKTIGRMDLPVFFAGKMPRYVWGQVIDTLVERAKKGEAPR